MGFVWGWGMARRGLARRGLGEPGSGLGWSLGGAGWHGALRDKSTWRALVPIQ